EYAYFDQLTTEKAARKQSELRLLNTEDAFDEERKVNEAKNESLSTSCRQTELKLQLAKDQVSRLEVKEQEWKKEENRLHERLNELIRTNVELTEQIKFINQQSNTPDNHGKNIIRKLSINPPMYKLTGSNNNQHDHSHEFDQSLTVDRSPVVHSNSPDIGYDATSGGFGFDEMPSTSESDGCQNIDDELPAGMRKEIDVLIKENMELVETKNALNIVKDDLLARIDYLSSENISLRESVDMLTQSRISLQSELTSTDQMLNDARSEINQLHEKLLSYQDKTADSTNPAQLKRFTRSEMARILAERNHYKERLLELQDAVRFTETLRVSQKGQHPELLMPKATVHNKFDTVSPVSGPLQSLQKFFSSFASGQRSETSGESIHNVEGDSSIHDTGVSLSWITLSATGTHSPIYGWATGKDTAHQFIGNDSNDSTNEVSNTPLSVPVPIQCRTIGGLHRKYLEICTALTVPVVSLDCNSKPKYHVWLIGRGGPADSINPNDSSLSVNRGYLGQVHIFEPTKFIHPIYSFDLDHGFLPTTAVYVKCNKDPASTSSSNQTIFTNELTSNNGVGYIDFTWDYNELYARSDDYTNNNFADDCVILASNDGRFLVYQTCYELKSTNSSDVSESCSSKSNTNDNEHNSSIHFNIRLPQIICRFNTNSRSLVASGMISCDSHVCIGLLNSLGTSQFVCLQSQSFIRNQHNDAENTITPSTKMQTIHKLINLPYESLSTGPLIMSSNSHCSTDHVWLGTAGGGYCYCLAAQSGDFITSLALPSETPCLHAIWIKPHTTKQSETIIWLSVSGNPTQCTPSKTNSVTMKKTCTNHHDVDLKDDNDGDMCTDCLASQHHAVSNQQMVTGAVSRGMARLIECCPKQKCILRQIDLTTSLSSMLDMENVTDPIDLTICRLLTVPLTSDHELWFATRSGLIARLHLNYSESKSSPNKVELPSSSSISVSCHGYRRPGCNLLLIDQIGQINDNGESNYLIVSIGHDYVDLRQIQISSEQSNDIYIHSTDHASNIIRHHVNRSRQMGSGAHAIVWRLTTLRQ
ncbi:C-Jun-amino-terminal kinase-interacting protein, partial [Schistosoma japonicum]